MKNKIKELDLTEQESKDLVNWLDNYGLKEIHDYQENWKFITDPSEKFNEDDHGKVCCICGEASYSRIGRGGKVYCHKHYGQMYQKGYIKEFTRRTPNEIHVHEGYTTVLCRGLTGDEEPESFIVSNESLKDVILHKWHLDPLMYPTAIINNKKTHINTFFKRTTSTLVTDHINRNTLDNRLENIREITQQENVINKSLQSNNTTGFIGVCWDKSRGKFLATIKLNGVMKNLGRFILERDCRLARLNAEAKYFGKYSPQRHLFKEYNIDTKGIIFDEDVEYIRPIEMSLKRALYLYSLLVV